MTAGNGKRVEARERIGSGDSAAIERGIPKVVVWPPRDHTLNLGDVDRAWKDSAGFVHLVCNCGKHLTGIEPEDATRQWVAHVNEEEG